MSEPLSVPVTLGSAEHRQADHTGFCATEVRFPAGLRLSRHYHGQCILAVVLEGGFDVHFRRHTSAVRPGWISCEPVAEPHGNDFCARDSRVLVLELDPDLQPEEIRRTGVFERVGSWRAPGVDSIARRLTSECARADSLSRFAADALFLELLVSAARRGFARKPATAPAWLERARDYLHAHAWQPLRLRAVAEAVGVTPVELSHTFRQYLQTTPGDYLRNLRLDWAMDALRNSSVPLAEIALSAGFSDQSHFSRWFRYRHNMSPGEFRRRARTRTADQPARPKPTD